MVVRTSILGVIGMLPNMIGIDGIESVFAV